MTVLAALQIGARPSGAAATLARILEFEPEIRGAGVDVLVLPEAVLGGYPKGETFSAPVGWRAPEGREAFAALHAAAVEAEGPEVAALAALARRTGAMIVAGIVERAGSSLYCAAVFLHPERGLAGVRRKLMPTGSERLMWGLGDGSGVRTFESPAGRVAAAICWENHMPLLRAALYADGVEIWCAPTVDEREIWRAAMRSIAYEGRCFLVSACQILPSPRELGREVPGWDPDRRLIGGGSLIASPYGEVLAGPLLEAEGLLAAEVDLSEIARARFDFDPSGHYARPDVFQLRVDRSRRVHASFRDPEPAGSAAEPAGPASPGVP